MTTKLASWTENIAESEIRRLLRVQTKYYMAGGKPGNLPLKCFSTIFKQIAEELQSENGNHLLNYGPTEGILELRKILQERLMKNEGVTGNVLITTGSQQTIYSVLKTIANPGDVVIAPTPTYLGFIGPCTILGIRIITVPMNPWGISIDDLTHAYNHSLAKYHKKPVAIYMSSFADNPTGYTPSWKNKTDIYNFAVSHKIIIIEDNAYKEITFNEKTKPIKSIDKENENVIYLCTTSKEAAVLRIGYSVIPDHINEMIIKLKGYMDLCTSSIDQHMAAKYYRNHIDNIIPKIRKIYQKQRNAMISALNKEIGTNHSNPKGGFFVWANLGIQNTKNILDEVIKECNLSYVPGEAFLINKKPTGYARLSYSSLKPNDIKYGIEKLAQFINNKI
ncbi:MAG: PLP-dependent aminotransferase family protein [Methanobacteriota archaeon]|nr:MAG: PLP-dependent aminotransferase family protein [Euryarchaeota archaeon]